MAGFANGLLGAGGGMLAVPILKKCGLEQKKCHSGSVAVIMPLSMLSAAMYIKSGSVDITDALTYIPWGIIGAVIGTVALKKISNAWLRRLFSCFMIWAGVKLLMR